MIRIKAMYSIVSTPSRKKGQKASPLQESKGGKPPTVWQHLSVFYQIIPVGATAEQKSGRISCRFLRREAPLRRGFFKSVPQAHRNYSLFTLHFYHPKQRKGEKPRHTPSVPGIARESPPQAEPGRSSRAQWEMMPGICARGVVLIESEKRQMPCGLPLFVNSGA